MFAMNTRRRENVISQQVIYATTGIIYCLTKESNEQLYPTPPFRHEKQGDVSVVGDGPPDAGEFIRRIVGSLCRLSFHITHNLHRAS